MSKKKRNYEINQGFVRRIAGRLFASREKDTGTNHVITNNGTQMNVGEAKWRPRKKQFERLDVDDDDDMESRTDEQYQNWTIQNVFSTEDDARVCQRKSLCEHKQEATKNHVRNSNKKRDLIAFGIKPPTKDTVAISVTGSHMSSTKRLKSERGNASDRLVTHHASVISSADEFGFQTQNSFASFHRNDVSPSRHALYSHITTGSSEHTFPDPSHNSASDNLKDFSSNVTVELTQKNLARMATMSASTPLTETIDSHQDVWCNSPSQGKFYQFALNKDKESTVVESNVSLSLTFGIKEDQDIEEINSVTSSFDDDIYSEDDDSTEAGVGSQKTRVQDRAPASFVNPSNQRINNDGAFFRDSERSKRNMSGVGDDFDTFLASKKDASDYFIAFPKTDDSTIDKVTSDDPFLMPSLSFTFPALARQESTGIPGNANFMVSRLAAVMKVESHSQKPCFSLLDSKDTTVDYDEMSTICPTMFLPHSVDSKNSGQTCSDCLSTAFVGDNPYDNIQEMEI